MADTIASKAIAYGRVGSTPTSGTRARLSDLAFLLLFELYIGQFTTRLSVVA